MALAPLLLLGATASAQTSYVEYLSQGLELLQAGRFEQALVLIDEAIESDGDPHFFLLRGVALNRLGRPGEALISLDHAERAGLALARVDLETGMAAVGIGAWELAAVRLERYEAAQPGEPRTALLLGRAYTGLGRFDEAEAQLRAAMVREPAVRPHALYYLARLEAARGDGAAARRYRAELDEVAGGSALARDLAQTLPTPSPWELSGGVTVGYNDNVLLTPEGQPLPTDVTNADSVFWSGNASARYRFALTPDDTLVPGYFVQGRLYNDVGTADFINQVASLAYARRFSPALEGTASLSGSDTRVDGDGFSEGVGLGASMSYRARGGVVVSGSYAFDVTDYDADPASAVENRDARRHSASLIAYLSLPVSDTVRPDVQLSVSYTANRADGSDHDYHGLGGALGATLALPWKLFLDGNVSYTRNDYDNPNSLAARGTAATFAFARDDHLLAYRVRLSRALSPGVEAFVAYAGTRNDSNITSFDYTQNEWSLGVSARF